jgi:hypothetical protein
MTTNHTERRQKPRYPVSVGFIEIGDRTLKVENVSEEGVGFYTDETMPFPEGEVHQGFLVLQHLNDQFEIPISFMIRRRVDTYVGALITYQDEQHRARVLDFIKVSSA